MRTEFGQKLRTRPLLILATILVGGALIFGGGWMVVGWIQARPKPPAQVRELVFAFLRDKSQTQTFDVPLGATLQETQTGLANEAALLGAQVAALQTNYDAARRELREGKLLAAATEAELVKLRFEAGITARPRKAVKIQASTLTNVPAEAGPLTHLTTTAGHDSNTVAAGASVDTNATLRLIAEKELELASRLKRQAQARLEFSKLSTNYTALKQEWNTKQRELASGTAEMAGERSKLTQAIHQRIREANSWEVLYKALGQELWVADEFLASSNLSLRQAGLELADQARDDALTDAENAWLAARICEGFVLPHLDLADNGGKSALDRDRLLASASQTFRSADENNNVIRTAQQIISQSANPKRADKARLQLARFLEQQGDYQGALVQYRSLQNSNNILFVSKRIAAVEARLKNSAKAKN